MIKVSTGLAIAQLPLAAGCLLAAMFFPPAGSPAVLINPQGGSAAQAIAWARGHDASLLGLSASGRDPIVRLSSNTDAFAALAAGFVPIAADLALCGAQTNNRGLTR